MRSYESERCRIDLFIHENRGADLYLFDKRYIDKKQPLHLTYDWYQKQRWEHDLDILIGVTGAEEVVNAA